jgi:hypothetical protein
MHLRHSGLRSSHLKWRRLQVLHPVRVLECRFLRRTLGTVDAMLIYYEIARAIMRDTKEYSGLEIAGVNRDEACLFSTFVSFRQGNDFEGHIRSPIHVLGLQLGPEYFQVLNIIIKSVRCLEPLRVGRSRSAD